MEIDETLCIQCGKCITRCPFQAIKEVNGKFIIEKDLCADCGACYDGCPANAIY